MNRYPPASLCPECHITYTYVMHSEKGWRPDGKGQGGHPLVTVPIATDTPAQHVSLWQLTGGTLWVLTLWRCTDHYHCSGAYYTYTFFQPEDAANVDPFLEGLGVQQQQQRQQLPANPHALSQLFGSQFEESAGANNASNTPMPLRRFLEISESSLTLSIPVVSADSAPQQGVSTAVHNDSTPPSQDTPASSSPRLLPTPVPADMGSRVECLAAPSPGPVVGPSRSKGTDERATAAIREMVGASLRRSRRTRVARSSVSIRRWNDEAKYKNFLDKRRYGTCEGSRKNKRTCVCSTPGGSGNCQDARSQA